jgi:hypothetical protein
MLGMVGCTDNESEGQKAASKEKDPGAVNPNSKSESFPQAQTQREQYEQSQKANLQTKGGGYPGAKK